MVVLHTDTKQGDAFYIANGFVKGNYLKDLVTIKYYISKKETSASKNKLMKSLFLVNYVSHSFLSIVPSDHLLHNKNVDYFHHRKA